MYEKERKRKRERNLTNQRLTVDTEANGKTTVTGHTPETKRDNDVQAGK